MNKKLSQYIAFATFRILGLMVVGLLFWILGLQTADRLSKLPKLLKTSSAAELSIKKAALLLQAENHFYKLTL